MDLRINNATGKNLYYRVLDYEGPFMEFREDVLPGMYPDGQTNYTSSDPYYDGNDTKVGATRNTIFSRYPKFAHPKNYMSNFGDGQLPSKRSYDEVSHNYPEQFYDRIPLNGNMNGVIPAGKARDLMLRDANCNLYFRTIGEPIMSRHKPQDLGLILGSSILPPNKIYQNDPRFSDYEGTIKVARLRETNLVIAIQYGLTYLMYDESGGRVQSEYVLDNSFIALQKTVSPFNINTDPRHLRLAQKFPFAPVNTLPKPTGTYTDMLRKQEMIRKTMYAARNPLMPDSNYSRDYDKPILGYFDRRWLHDTPN